LDPIGKEAVMDPPRRPRGLSLPELLVTLAIAAILATAAAPSFRAIALNARRDDQVNALLRALHGARSAAILRAEPVVLCKSRDGAQCVTDASAWSDGWIAFANRDHDSPPRLDPGERVLITHPRSERVVVRANRNAVTYWPVALAGTTASFVFCDARGTRAARAIIVSQTGRPRVSSRDAAGKPLRCQ
jgi:type IV fimbrial biogenesis protein FimT